MLKDKSVVQLLPASSKIENCITINKSDCTFVVEDYILIGKKKYKVVGVILIKDTIIAKLKRC